MPWAYLLLCGDGSLYGGSTVDLDGRMEQHSTGHGGAYTRDRQPVSLVWAQEFERIDEAWAMERRLHGWSRAKRWALIEGRLGALPELSRNGRRRDADE